MAGRSGSRSGGSSPRGNNEGDPANEPASNGSTNNPGRTSSRPAALRLRPGGQGGARKSPDEVVGEAPEVSEVTPTTLGFMEMLTHNHPQPDVRPMGFTNGPAPKYPSNMCYRNSATSMLLNLPYFSSFLTGGWADLAESAEMTALQRLAVEYWEAGSSAADDRPKQERLDRIMNRFFGRFQNANPNFTDVVGRIRNNYRQEDSAEFLNLLLDSAHDQLGQQL
jgi:Ubiquitin carboxyl-terminal hydrolase